LTGPVYRPWQFFLLAPFAFTPLLYVTSSTGRDGFDSDETALLVVCWGLSFAFVAATIVWLVTRGAVNRRIVRIAANHSWYGDLVHPARLQKTQDETSRRLVLGVDPQQRMLIELTESADTSAHRPVYPSRIASLRLHDSSLVPNAVQVLEVTFEDEATVLVELLGAFDGVFPLLHERAEEFVSKARAALDVQNA
jgi:hypothetical protein